MKLELPKRGRGSLVACCMFINAAAEFTAQDDAGHIFSVEHKRLMHEYIKGLAERARAQDPALLAWQLNLLIEGQL